VSDEVQTMVRMGELAVSDTADDTLVSIGLGSCIGLVLVDDAQPLAGLAHIVLPESGPGEETGGQAKFADRAVPALVHGLEELGARRSRLRAALVGGAEMFSFGSSSGFEIGARNEAATREALDAAGITVRAAATSGSHGRTVRVRVGDGVVTAREAGGPDTILLNARPTPSREGGAT
jgi:chemotaxis protein CheD